MKLGQKYSSEILQSEQHLGQDSAEGVKSTALAAVQNYKKQDRIVERSLLEMVLRRTEIMKLRAGVELLGSRWTPDKLKIRSTRSLGDRQPCLPGQPY